MKKQDFPIMKKTCLLQAIYELVHMLFSLFAAHGLSEITEGIQGAAVREAMVRCLGLILIWIFYGTGLTLFFRLLISTRLREQIQVREGIFYRIIHADHRKRVRAGQVLENLGNDCGRVTEHYGRRLPVAAVTALSAAVYFGVAITLSPAAAFFMLLLAMLQALPPLAVKHLFMKNYLDCREIEAEITDVFIAGYKGAEEIRVYGGLPWLNGILYKKHREYEKVGMKSEMAFTGQTMIASLVGQLARYGYFAVLGLLFSMKMISASHVAAMVVISGAFFSGMSTLFQVMPEFAVDRAALHRINGWEERPAGKERGLLPALTDGKGKKLHVEGMGQSYGDRKIFQDFTVDFPLDKRVALCGGNGSGKTTFLRMVAGQTKGEQGRIWSDQGYWERLAAGSGIAYLPQECPGLCFSIYDLMEEGNECFQKLAGEFGLEESVMDSPLASLSGGQKKKIYLAAAFSRQAPLLILDEPDNELDEAGKTVLREQMLTYPGGILYVTHERDFLMLAQVKIDLDEMCGGVL